VDGAGLETVADVTAGELVGTGSDAGELEVVAGAECDVSEAVGSVVPSAAAGGGVAAAGSLLAGSVEGVMSLVEERPLVELSPCGGVLLVESVGVGSAVDGVVSVAAGESDVVVGALLLSGDAGAASAVVAGVSVGAGAPPSAFAGVAKTPAARATSAILPQTLRRTAPSMAPADRNGNSVSIITWDGVRSVRSKQRVRPLLTGFAALSLAACSHRVSWSGSEAPAARTAPVATIHWRSSAAIGVPSHGRLVRGVRFPAGGRHFFSWDPVRRRSPDRGRRRYGTDGLVRTLLRVIRDYAAAHPGAPRVGIGDLSRPRGGDFGILYGRPGHVSHQNGLDADVYYPRRDGSERPPARPAQIEHALAQDLVDRFVRIGAARIFVGPHTGLTGPRSVVQVLAHHDNHLHVRLPQARA
jgi:penicillin-insensitive murein endopeptidase